MTRTDLLIVGEDAYGKRIPTRDLRRKRRGGQGVVVTSGPPVAGSLLVGERDHVLLATSDGDSATPWCAEIERLSPAVLGHEIKAAPVKPRRVDGAVRRLPLDGHVSRKQLAGWPRSLRPEERSGDRLYAPSC